jgi:hypothetical protein
LQLPIRALLPLLGANAHRQVGVSLPLTLSPFISFKFGHRWIRRRDVRLDCEGGVKGKEAVEVRSGGSSDG